MRSGPCGSLGTKVDPLPPSRRSAQAGCHLEFPQVVAQPREGVWGKETQKHPSCGMGGGLLVSWAFFRGAGKLPPLPLLPSTPTLFHFSPERAAYQPASRGQPVSLQLFGFLSAQHCAGAPRGGQR